LTTAGMAFLAAARYDAMGVETGGSGATLINAGWFVVLSVGVDVARKLSHSGSNTETTNSSATNSVVNCANNNQSLFIAN